METCGAIAFRDIAGFPREPLGCLRPHWHTGPHLIQRENGTFIAYEIDWGCDCYSCNMEDMDQWCEVYTEVTEDRAKHLVAEPEYPWKW
jgi:hypothetical protein